MEILYTPVSDSLQHVGLSTRQYQIHSSVPHRRGPHNERRNDSLSVETSCSDALFAFRNASSPRHSGNPSWRNTRSCCAPAALAFVLRMCLLPLVALRSLLPLAARFDSRIGIHAASCSRRLLLLWTTQSSLSVRRHSPPDSLKLLAE